MLYNFDVLLIGLLISIIRYGSANTGSISSMLRKLSLPHQIIHSPEEIISADKLILPGVGSFDAGVRSLKESLAWDALQEVHAKGSTPLLGICLGMQLLGISSEEGHLDGLGFISGACTKIRPPSDSTVKVPHMGWNSLTIRQPQNALISALPDPSRFYFVHSYCFQCNDPLQNSVATAFHGHTFDVIINSGPIYGVQFHPEKSHVFGLSLLRQFATL